MLIKILICWMHCQITIYKYMIYKPNFILYHSSHTALYTYSSWLFGKAHHGSLIQIVRAFTYGVLGHRIDLPLSYFSFQPVLHNWCTKGCGMCHPVCGIVHIKEPLLLIGKSSPCGGSRFPLLSRYLNGPLPHVWRHITVNKMCWVHR